MPAVPLAAHDSTTARECRQRQRAFPVRLVRQYLDPAENAKNVALRGVK
jgi:hypothetical protein